MADCDLFLYSPVVAIARTRVKNPYALAQISPSTNPSDLWEARLNFKSIRPLRSMSKLQIYQTFGKHVQNSNPWTSGKYVQNSISMDLWEARPKFQSLDLWEARLNFKSIGPLRSTSKIQILGPLGSTFKIQDHDWNPHFVLTTGKHVLYSFFSIKKKKQKQKQNKTKQKKTKKGLHAWTTFRPDPPTKRYVGNLLWDSVHILLHNMTVCIFIYMHHTFTMVKYLFQS